MKAVRCILLLALGFLLALGSVAQAQEAGPVVLVLRVDGAITPALGDYVERGLERAVVINAEAVVLLLNTPGGDVNTTIDLMQSFENAAVPVIVYVSPRGGQAMSAGTYLTLAAHGAAMAPHTTLGAAHPVDSSGGDLPDTISEKLVNALVGKMGNVTRRRGEAAAAWAERAVRESIVANEEEALALGVVDKVAVDMNDLLAQFDGEMLEVGGQAVTLNLRGARIEELSQTPLEELLHFLTDPNVVAVLMVIGVQAILIELSSPGGWIAGFIGAVSLALAAYGIGILPVNWLGMAFIVVAFALFIIDIKAPTHGALTAAGLGSMITGLLVFFNTPVGSPFGRVSPVLAVGLAGFSAALFAFVIAKVVQIHKRRPVTGREGLLQARGIAKTDLTPEGMVLVAGERWQARAADDLPILAGSAVVVVARENFRLVVRQIEA